jgi:phenylacetate-CoA ligase
MPGDRLKERAFWWKNALFRRHALRLYRWLLGNERLSRDELESLNWTRRRQLVSYAYERSPFYREKYRRAGLHPQDLKRPEDFALVPCLTREELRADVERMVVEGDERKYLAPTTTGGTTGVPVKVYRDSRVPIEAIGWRMLRWWGIGPHVDGAYAWRMRRKPGLGRILNALAWWPTRRLRLDAAVMTEGSIRLFLEGFNRLRPPLLQGYTGAITNLALFIEQRGLEVHSPKAIWVTSSPISGVEVGLIERAFRAPVYDQYGSCEVPWLSAQCAARGGLHINHDTVHVEFVGPDGRQPPAGESGMVAVTDLLNYPCPLIRYLNGDEGRPLEQACSCGVSLPLMAGVRGRLTEAFRFPNGTCISGEYLTTIFDAFPAAVHQFQVRQAPDHSVRVLYVPNRAYAGLPEALKAVRTALEAKVQNQAQVSLEPVDSIPDDRGKLRFVLRETAP